MHLLLIRHGESVDNVANLYAGSRDSPLTSHGVLQTRRLGAHLASRRSIIGPITHIFTSNLQRAYRTAEAIAEAQRGAAAGSDKNVATLKVVQLAELREKDFGSGEGVKYKALATGRADGSIASDSETREAMMVRVNRFIVDELVSVLEAHQSEKVTAAIVAHGLILGTLLQALITSFPVQVASATSPELGRPGAAWSNTGVLQAKIEGVASLRTTAALSGTPSPLDRAAQSGIGDDVDATSSRLTMTVQHINNTDHLGGLKKTRGGIGSAKFDERQRPVTAFFTPISKKRKAEDYMQ
ncbi:histidine phosphatase superfamily [Truncatella angustata]|uniref:Histidine phosphatase superfamily n=1 Tax=Truncatella angustata TaxID=152316 RepID=A0A9P8UQP9_9PEZI|nr:histidine phosphatase superfamily [Truncatella angustata]KAH6656608.1 histidine phosphatase superfamily [Truncatella angustata]KAH8201537.1 hypothetical protein TruAng_004308 [Truncatella angustata]